MDPVVSCRVPGFVAGGSKRQTGGGTGLVHWTHGRRGCQSVVRFSRTVLGELLSGSSVARARPQPLRKKATRHDSMPAKVPAICTPGACCCSPKGVSPAVAPVLASVFPVLSRGARQTQVSCFLAVCKKNDRLGLSRCSSTSDHSRRQGASLRILPTSISSPCFDPSVKFNFSTPILFDCPGFLSHARRLRSRPCRVAARANQRRLLVEQGSPTSGDGL